MSEARKAWFAQRVAAIHERVTAYEVLRLNGIDLNQSSDDQAEQISCPFHGADAKPSARIHPEEGDNHSHVWCYVCQVPGWDAIGLWRKFNNDCSFGQALSGLERAFGLTTPEAPKEGFKEPEVDEDLERFKRHYMAAESRLKSLLGDFKRIDGMDIYLKAGRILDRTKFRVDKKAWPARKGLEALSKMLERIGEKVRECEG